MPTENFTTDGTFAIPQEALNVRLLAKGAKGEDGGDGLGGEGGIAEINVGEDLSGETVTIRVGYGGGGVENARGGTGGGAADVRVNGTSLSDRIVVGAGGGGGGGDDEGTGGAGGAGGADTGESGVAAQSVDAPTGGTQSAGGDAGQGSTDSRDGTAGAFGLGGDSGGDSTSSGGGGGSGWYGGGGGGSDALADFAASGAGGSNYTDSTYTEVTNQRGGSTTAEVEITYDLPPDVPQNLTVTVVDSDSLDISWDAVTADGYELYRSQDPNVTTNDTLVIDTPNTSYSDTGLLDGTEYYYRVLAYNQNGPSELSNEDSAVTTLPAPTNLTASNVTNDGATLNWTSNHTNGETRVEYKLTSDAAWITFSTVGFGTETETLTGLLDGQAYDARVVAQTTDTETIDN